MKPINLMVGGCLVLSLVGPVLAGSGLAVRQIKPPYLLNTATGQTIEQENAARRLTEDNKVGSVKHLYVISPVSGQVILYSSVRGKVTSSGKRLSPRTTRKSYPCGENNKDTCYDGQEVFIQGIQHLTTEIIQDDGTYGSSSPYLYWFDSNGVYHQHFITDGQVIRISDQPIKANSPVINLDVRS